MCVVHTHFGVIFCLCLIAQQQYFAMEDVGKIIDVDFHDFHIDSVLDLHMNENFKNTTSNQIIQKWIEFNSFHVLILPSSLIRWN